MKIGVTGASGFIGQVIVARLVRSGHSVRCLVRTPESGASFSGRPGIETSIGDVTKPETLEKFVSGLDAVVHSAARTSEGVPDPKQSQAINVEGTRHILDACKKAGCRRFIHISSQSAKRDNPTTYGQTKWLSEELVRSSGLEETILRPSTVYGPGTRGLFAKMAHLTKTVHVIPVIGKGQEQFRPVHVDDVVSAVEASLQKPASVHRVYDLGGGDITTFSGFIRSIAEVLGTFVIQIHLPIWFCRFMAVTMSRIMANPPMTIDNIIGLTHLEACDNRLAETDLSYRPRGLAEGLRNALKG